MIVVILYSNMDLCTVIFEGPACFGIWVILVWIFVSLCCVRDGGFGYSFVNSLFSNICTDLPSRQCLIMAALNWFACINQFSISVVSFSYRTCIVQCFCAVETACWLSYMFLVVLMTSCHT